MLAPRSDLPPPYDALVPPDSSSDDGSNDSFTCSEFEYDNEKAGARDRFQPNRLLFPKLPETENEHEETSDAGIRTFTYDASSTGTGRDRDSLSTFFSSDDELPQFAVSQSSGTITIKSPLDYELTQTYSLWLEARDSASEPELSSYLRLDILITDRNDNNPVFDRTLYNVTVMEEDYPPIR